MTGPRLVRVAEDQAERLRALDPGASFLVQAPAGSGKTTLLVQRFLVLLSRVTEPEAIVAITFTRRAAAEMRARVVAALEGAAPGNATSPATDRLTAEAATAALEQDRHQGWRLRENPARLRVQTIDSLCASIVQRMPWTARLGGMPRILEDATDLYREAARNTLRRVAGSGAVARAAERLLRHLDNDFRAVEAMLEALLPRRDQWLRHLGVGAAGAEVREALEAALRQAVSRGLRRAARRIAPLTAAALRDSVNFAGRNVSPPLPDLEAFPGHAPEDREAWLRIAGLLLTGKNEWRRTVDARSGFPAAFRREKADLLNLLAGFERDEELLAALKEIRRLPEPRFAAAQWEVLEALLALLPVAAAELKVVFRERAATDFVELGEAARRALGPADQPTDLAFALGERIEHLLVDEFQDTSISQLELLERLVAGWEAADVTFEADRTLFLVGDPMQSIYRFREAEVGLFLRARTAGVRHVACEPVTLRVNFRARPEIIEWVNHAFARLFPEAEDAALGAVRFTASVAHRGAASGSGVTVWPMFAEDAAAEAETVARLVEEAAPGTRAILVRARAHALAITAELRRRGIAYRAVEFDPLAERPAVQDLLALTRALLHLGDRTAWFAVLRAPWCGATLAQLHDLAGSDAAAILWDRIASSGLACVPALEAALARIRRAPVRECVEAAWRALGGPAAVATESDLADCLRFLALLEELDQGGDIPNLDRLDERAALLYAQPAPAAGGFPVEVMTIHKAKGLEFETVIVPGLGREAAADGRALLRWAEVATEEGTSLVFAPVEATEDSESDPIYHYLGHLDRQRGRNEAVRLLYVAATRARERLHLLGHVDSGADGMKKPRQGTLLELLWPAVEDDFARAWDRLERPPGPPQPAPLPQYVRRILHDGQPAASPLPGTANAPAEAVRFEWVGDTLRHAGTVAHEWLHRVAHESLAAWPAGRVAKSRPAIRAALDGLGLPAEQAAQACDLVERALSAALAGERGRWILAPHQEAAAELGLSAVDGSTVRHYSVDRTFVEGGVRWIIDYKLGTHEGAGLDAFLDAERERYRARMDEYARAFRLRENRPIRLGLYYPLVGGWREWDPGLP